MNILIVIPSVSKKWGGTTTSLVNFYKGLMQKKNTHCTVLTAFIGDEKSDISVEILANDDFFLFPTTSTGWRRSKKLKDYLKENAKSFDLVWIHGLWTGTTYYAAIYAKKYNVPYIITPHGMIEPDALKRKYIKKKLYWSLIEKRVFNNAAAIHCITEEEAGHAKQLTKTKNFVISNGIEEESFLEKEYDQLKSICFIGRFHEKKALDLLLKAVAKIDNIKLLVAGGGELEYEKYIYTLVKKLQIEDRVVFKGFVDHVIIKEMFKNCAFLVLPSHSEGRSMVGLESVMNSTPVLTTVKCNFNEVEKYNAGMVMQNNDPATIKQYILEMFDSDIEEMSTNAYKLAMEEFCINSVSHKLLTEFNRVI
jgi:glycosyltransferase involved in cell wall biosynthesis